MLLLKDGLGAGLVFGLVAAALPLNLLMVFISTGPRFFVHTSFVSRLFFCSCSSIIVLPFDTCMHNIVIP